MEDMSVLADPGFILVLIDIHALVGIFSMASSSFLPLVRHNFDFSGSCSHETVGKVSLWHSLTKFHFNVSALNEHRFRYNFDCLNPICSCGIGKEGNEHSPALPTVWLNAHISLRYSRRNSCPGYQWSENSSLFSYMKVHTWKIFALSSLSSPMLAWHPVWNRLKYLFVNKYFVFFWFCIALHLHLHFVFNI